MKLPYYHVDAFSSELFRGNPAGVCPLERWLPDAVLQNIATENNLSETAFFAPADEGFDLRWFTPTVEVDLCGHATVASAEVLFSELNQPGNTIRFQTRSGPVTTARRGALIELDFPSRPPAACPGDDLLARALGHAPREVLKARDYLGVYDSQSQVAALTPDFTLLERLDSAGIIVTARGENCDFVSRYFAPRAGIPEDPVTGSSHCSLIPFWAGRLGKNELFARQISRRGGELHCRLLGDRVAIGGRSVIFGRGFLEVPVS